MPYKKETHYVFNNFGRREAVETRVPVMGRKDLQERRRRASKNKRLCGVLEFAKNGLTIFPSKDQHKPHLLADGDTLRISKNDDPNFLLKGKVVLNTKKRPEELLLVVDHDSSTPEQDFPIMTLEMLEPYMNADHTARAFFLDLIPYNRLPKLK